MKKFRVLKSHFYAADRSNETLCETKSRKKVTVRGSVTCKRCAWLMLGVRKITPEEFTGKFLLPRKD